MKKIVDPGWRDESLIREIKSVPHIPMEAFGVVIVLAYVFGLR